MEGPCRLPALPACGAQPATAAASPIFSRAGESPHEVLLLGEGDHNHPLPAQNSGSLPAVLWGEGDHNHPLPTQAAAGHVGDAMGKGKPSSPFPSEQPRAAAPAGPRVDQGGETHPPQEGRGRRLRRTRGAARRRSWRMGGPAMRSPNPRRPVLPSCRDTEGGQGAGGGGRRSQSLTHNPLA